MAARTQDDTEFLARELAAVRLALADVVTTQDLEDSLSRLAKVITHQPLPDGHGSLTSADKELPRLGRYQRSAGEGGDVERARVLAVHQIASAAQVREDLRRHDASVAAC